MDGRGGAGGAGNGITLQEALAAALEGDDARDLGLGLVRRMLEIGFLELADAEDVR